MARRRSSENGSPTQQDTPPEVRRVEEKLHGGEGQNGSVETGNNGHLSAAQKARMHSEDAERELILQRLDGVRMKHCAKVRLVLRCLQALRDSDWAIVEKSAEKLGPVERSALAEWLVRQEIHGKKRTSTWDELIEYGRGSTKSQTDEIEEENERLAGEVEGQE